MLIVFVYELSPQGELSVATSLHWDFCSISGIILNYL